MRVRPDPCVGHVAAWVEQQGEALNADFSQAERFLRALDPVATRFSFRTFSDTPYTRRPGWDPLQRAIHASLTDCWQELVDLNRKGAAVSVTINRTSGEGREVADMQQVRALFLDDDHPVKVLDRFPLPPHIQVLTSPGHYHHYWLVQDLPLSRFSELQRQLAQHYGGDHRVMALNQSMQLAGLWRRKSLMRPLLPALHRIKSFPPYPAAILQDSLLQNKPG